MATALLLPPTTVPTPPKALANPNPNSAKPFGCSSLPLPKSFFPRFQIRCSSTGPSLSSSGFGFEHERVVYPRPAEIAWSKELCNSVHLIGIVGTPVQIKHLSSGKVVAWSRLAVKKSATDTNWINLTFWDELAHVAFQHVEKGQQIYVRGRLISDTIGGDDEKRNYYKGERLEIFLKIMLLQQKSFGKPSLLTQWIGGIIGKTSCSSTYAALHSSSNSSSWDPTISLAIKHPTLVLLERCRSREYFKLILAKMMRVNLITETFPMSRLIFSVVSKLESSDMAILLFNHFTPQPNLYIYNTMISALSFRPREAISMYKSMLLSSVYPDHHTLLHLLKATKCLSIGRQIHVHAIITGFSSCIYLQNSLIKMYTENGQMDLAHQVFQMMPEHDIVSWNVIISGHSSNGCCSKAIELFREMADSGVEADDFTVVSLFNACGQLSDSRQGKSVHAWIEKKKLDFPSNLIVDNALLGMYVKLEALKLAQRGFDRMENRDLISWNTMISAYAKVGELEISCQLFNGMPMRDLVSWNSLIAGYAQKGDCRNATMLFKDMILENVRPDKVTIIALISAAAVMRSLSLGRWANGWLFKIQVKLDAFLGSALIDMYSKCGSIERALAIFKIVSERDVMVWTSMIAGLAFHGYGKQALELFKKMQECLRPNAVTILAVLTACGHNGMVNKGLSIFYNMKKTCGVEPDIEHYGCLVDLLGRAGKLNEAMDVIESMPMKPSRSIWGSLLSACRSYGNVLLAETALGELLKLEPEKEGGYVLLSNVYSACRMWGFSNKIRRTMENKGVKKMAGCSSVVVNGISHEFVAADERHPRGAHIYCLLKVLNRELRLSFADVPESQQQYLLDPYLE